MTGGGNQGKRDQSTTPFHRKPQLPAPGSGLCSLSPLDPPQSGSAPPPAAERDHGEARSTTNPPVTLTKGNFLLAAPGAAHRAGYCMHTGGSTAPHLPPTTESSFPSSTFCHMVLLSITSSSSSTAASSAGGCSLPFSRQCCLYRFSITLAEERAGLTHPQWSPRLWGSTRAECQGARELPNTPVGSSQPGTPLPPSHLCGQDGPSVSAGAAGKLSCRPGTRYPQPRFSE